MAKPHLDADYWRNDFAITDGDLNLLVRVLGKAASLCG